MASSAIMLCEALLCFLIISKTGAEEPALQFRVGGLRGWVEPTGNETETYNEWAMRNRFHVGDSLYFKYSNDSVLVVRPEDYDSCSISNPISVYEDGNTEFTFDHYGFFYFISGIASHCQAGQKLIVQVMAQSEVQSPASAPAPSSVGREIPTIPPPSGRQATAPSIGLVTGPGADAPTTGGESNHERSHGDVGYERRRHAPPLNMQSSSIALRFPSWYLLGTCAIVLVTGMAS